MHLDSLGPAALILNLLRHTVGRGDFDSLTKWCNIAGGTRTITIGIPQFSNPGSTYGFAVEFTNPFSSIKYDIDTGNYSYEAIRVLDPLPVGSGEWLELPVIKWDANFVSRASSGYGFLAYSNMPYSFSFIFKFRIYSDVAAQQDLAFKMIHLEAKSNNIWLWYDPKHFLFPYFHTNTHLFVSKILNRS